MPEASDHQQGATSAGVGSSRREPIEVDDRAQVPDAVTIRRSGSSVSPAARRSPEGPAPYPVEGDRIDTYQLEAAIGAGGMGAVFRAMDLRLDRLVALKLLPPEHSKDSDSVQRFYQEARAAARLDHENIARVFTIGHDRSYHYIAFEYIEGTTIRQRVNDQGPMGVAEVINYTLQIAGALVHASERGVVHRDIKPSNIIVTPQGRAKLVDMGLARSFERDTAAQDGLTQSGMTLGTFDYISPEQAQDPRNVDVRSDLYSLGCTMFHMLTGRPPFPEGTVLQKLLQHREEPAPDVRTLNPAVPADLSAIILKLMAKDPDRRYPTPGQLARDLMLLAGSLGLRSVSPEGLAWIPASVAPPWGRHLVWGVPSMGLAVVVALLVWWGEDNVPARDRLAGLTKPTFPANARSQSPSSDGPQPLIVDPGTTAKSRAATLAKHAEKTSTERSEYVIRSVDQLTRMLDEAPWGATLILAIEGPFDLDPTPSGSTAPGVRNLTIRAAPGVRPVLRPNLLTLDTITGSAALLRFRGGRIVLEGLEFRLDPGDREETLAAVLAEGTDLTIRGCLFRTKSSSQSATRLDAIRLGANLDPIEATSRPSPVLVRESHFDGGQSALHVQGPADVRVAECTFGPSAPAPTFWFENGRLALPPKVNLALDHVSVLAGSAPVFRLEHSGATIRLNDSIVAPPIGIETTLLATDDPDGLDWLGRGNLYARIGTYLQPTRPLSRWEPITRFVNWEEEPTRTREIDTSASASTVWATADPVDLARGGEPTVAFLPDPTELPEGVVGVRIGPSGPVAPTIAREPANLLIDLGTGEALALESATNPSAPRNQRNSRTSGSAESGRQVVDSFGLPRDDEYSPMSPGTTQSAPSRTSIAASPDPIAQATGSDGSSSADEPERVTSSRSTISNTSDDPEPPGGELVRSAMELRRILEQAEAPEDAIVIAGGTTLLMDPQPIRGSGRWVIRAADSEAGRPILRLRRGEVAGPDGKALFMLDSTSSLELRGLDVIVEETNPAATSSTTSGFVMEPGAYLNLVGCTVTVVDEQRSTAVARVVSGRSTSEATASESTSTTSIRAIDCLIRSSLDVVDVGAGRAAKLWFENCVIGAGGTLVTGHGQRRDGTTGLVELELNRCTSRLSGGLVVLQSTSTQPSLPLAEARVRDSILATSRGGGPLLRVIGQDAVSSVGDRIRWQGNSVAYHQIETYRRDQTSQPGYMPLSFDRTDWGVAVGTRDVSPFHGDVGFLASWDEDRPDWSITPEDVRLSSDSSVRSYGPDLDLVATPATDRSEY